MSAISPLSFEDETRTQTTKWPAYSIGSESLKSQNCLSQCPMPRTLVPPSHYVATPVLILNSPHPFNKLRTHPPRHVRRSRVRDVKQTAHLLLAILVHWPLRLLFHPPMTIHKLRASCACARKRGTASVGRWGRGDILQARSSLALQRS
jgi:hypothetical protein